MLITVTKNNIDDSNRNDVILEINNYQIKAKSYSISAGWKTCRSVLDYIGRIGVCALGFLAGALVFGTIGFIAAGPVGAALNGSGGAMLGAGAAFYKTKNGVLNEKRSYASRVSEAAINYALGSDAKTPKTINNNTDTDNSDNTIEGMPVVTYM